MSAPEEPLEEENSFNKFSFPTILRSTLPDLLISDLVSVQPLSGPTGMVFHMDLIGEEKEVHREDLPMEDFDS